MNATGSDQLSEDKTEVPSVEWTEMAAYQSSRNSVIDWRDGLAAQSTDAFAALAEDLSPGSLVGHSGNLTPSPVFLSPSLTHKTTHRHTHGWKGKN